jgi:hypothetical protein
LLHAVFLTEFFHATGGIDDLLFAGIERMAQGAHFDMQVPAVGGTRLEAVSAAASDVDFFVIRVSFGLHALLSFRGYRRKGAIIDELRK